MELIRGNGNDVSDMIGFNIETTLDIQLENHDELDIPDREDGIKISSNCPLPSWLEPKHIVQYVREFYILDIAKHALFAPFNEEGLFQSALGTVKSLKEYRASGVKLRAIKEWSWEEVNQKEALALFALPSGHVVAMVDKLKNFIWIKSFKATNVEFMQKLVKSLISLVRQPSASKTPATKGKFNIGADIEYTIFDSEGKFHDATEFVADSQEGAIGTDGNVGTLEIRPRHSSDPLVLVENIEKLLLDLNDEFPTGYDLMNGGGRNMQRSTGVHIHFSNTSIDLQRDVEAPAKVVRWLDELIYEPILKHCRNVERADEHYGRPGDYRWRRNHNEFPHDGFEWRGLPTITVNKRFTQAVFVMAYMVMKAYESYTKIKYDENRFSIDWYKGLPDFKENEELVEYFVNQVGKGLDLGVPALHEWFHKNFEKDKECDVEVLFANDQDNFLAIKGFVMYNPQKMYDRVVFWSKGEEDKVVYLSDKCPNLKSYCIKDLGHTVLRESPSATTVTKYDKARGKTLYIGISSQLLHRFAARNVGSRNRVKMFAQDLVKNI